MGSLYFDTYHTCQLEKMASLTSDSFEFYHDKDGLTTSKTAYIESTRKHICGKVTPHIRASSSYSGIERAAAGR